MAHTLWKGYISLGLMNIPVQLHKAADEPTSVSFREINAKTGNPVGRKRVDKQTGEDVDYNDIVKGYEISPDNYVKFTKEEIESLHPQRTSQIEIEGFVDADSIPASRFDEPYFVGTDETGGKPYKILAESMRAKGKIAIGKIVMRSTERLVALVPTENGITMSTLRWAEQMRTNDMAVTDVEVAPEEIELGSQLIDAMTKPVDLDAYTNEYNASVHELIEARAQNPDAEPIVAATYEPERPDDILEILRQSLQQQRNKEENVAALNEGTA